MLPVATKRPDCASPGTSITNIPITGRRSDLRRRICVVLIFVVSSARDVSRPVTEYALTPEYGQYEESCTPHHAHSRVCAESAIQRQALLWDLCDSQIQLVGFPR